jgi:transposase-like protein
LSWVHPDVAINIAQWISPKFNIQISRWIRELIITGTVSIDSKKSNQELIELTGRLQIKEDESKEQQKRLEEQEAKLKKVEEELKEKEKVQKWLSEVTKNKISFEVHGAPTDGIYMGADRLNLQSMIEKIGKASKNTTREWVIKFA